MATLEAQNPVANELPQVSVDTLEYETAKPNAVNRFKNAVHNRYVSSVRFILTIHGLLNVVIIIALACVLISAGLANTDDAKLADGLSFMSKAKVSAYHTRNADLAFAIFGIIFFLIDTIIYMTPLIRRLPELYDLITVIIVFVLAAIYLILGCCSAAWAKKMSDIKTGGNQLGNIGAPIAAAFFLFIALIATILNGILRLIRPRSRSNNS